VLPYADQIVIMADANRDGRAGVSPNHRRGNLPCNANHWVLLGWVVVVVAAMLCFFRISIRLGYLLD
jgi:hypothetical protein